MYMRLLWSIVVSGRIRAQQLWAYLSCNTDGGTGMARKIKETPVLTGKDAQRFDQLIKANESKKISKEEYSKVVSSYRRFRVVNPADRD